MHIHVFMFVNVEPVRECTLSRKVQSQLRLRNSHSETLQTLHVFPMERCQSILKKTHSMQGLFAALSCFLIEGGMMT